MIETEPVDPTPSPPVNPIPNAATEKQGFLRAALLLSIGNIVSRILGLVRETVKANLFGTSGALSAFQIATFVPMSIFQLIIGGEMVNSSLVPVFSEYAASDKPEKRRELWEVVSIFLSVAVLVLLLCVVLIELFAPAIAALLGANQFSDPALQALTVHWMRVASPAVLFLSLASFISGVLYALKRFTLPAFTTAILNGSFILFALVANNVEGLVWGLLAGSLLQVVVQLPGLRDARLRWNVRWRHPAMRRILILYAPIVAGLVVNRLSEGASYRLATAIGDRSVAFMTYATTLYQFPQGLVATALAMAILPTLSRQALGSVAEFKQTLAGGLRLVLVLILPATLGLFALAEPTVRLLFESGQFMADDTAMVTLMLRYYLIGLPFAAIDLMLVSALYARQDTWRPALIGVFSVGFYWLAALAFLRPLGLLTLMVADAVKQIVHVGMMLFVLRREVGPFEAARLWPTLLKALAGSLATAGVAWATAERLVLWLPPVSLINQALVVVLAGAAGLATYALCVYLLDLREARETVRLLLRR